MNNHNLNSLCLILYLSIIQVSFSQEVKLGLPLGHKYPVASFNFSADSKFIISSSSDGTKLWESSTGYLLNSFDEERGINTDEISRDEAKAYAIIINSRRKRRSELLNTDKLINSYKLDDKVESVVLNGTTKLYAVNFSNGDSQVFTMGKRKVASISFQQSKTLAIVKNSLDEDVIILMKNKLITGYNLNTKKSIYSIPGFYDGECGFTISPNHKYFLVNACTSFSQYSANIGASNGFEMYDVTNGKLIHSFYPSVNELRHASISKNQKYLSVVSHARKSQVLDLSTGKLTHVLDTEYAISSEFSSDSKYLVTTSDMRLIEDEGMGNELIMKESQWIWNISNGSLISILESTKGNNNEFEHFELSVSYDDSKTAIIWKIEDGLANPYKELIGHSAQIIFTTLSPDGKMAVTSSKDQTVKVWDAYTGKLLHTLKDYSSNATFAQFNNDNQNLLTLSEDGTQKVWDLSAKQLLHTIQFENKDKIKEDGISNGVFLDGSSLIIRDVKTGKQLVRQFVFNSKDLLWLLTNGYYFASKEAASKLYYIKGLQTIGFEQLDVKYNRPDKVLEVLGSITGSKDTTMIKAYKKAWQKRIKKLEIDTTSFKQGFSIPESNFANREAIAYEQNNSELKLHIKALDSTYLLDRFNIWINEVPVYGNKGISLKNKKKHTVDTTLTVTLSNGINKIETSVLNVNGIESYRLPLYVNHTPKEVIKEKLFFVGIGVDRQTAQKLTFFFNSFPFINGGFSVS